jgi:hypothetical protein
MANQYDPIVIKSGLAGVLGTDTLRADVIAHAGLTTTGLSSGDVVQVTANLTLSKAVNTSTSPIIGVYDGMTGSIVREGIVVATFKTAPTANGDAVYLSDAAGKLTTTKPTKDMVHEVGVVVDYANRKILLQQKPVISLPASSEGYLIVAGGMNWDGSTNKTETYQISTGVWTSRPNLTQQRYLHDLVALSDGRALISGGHDGAPLSSAAVFSRTTWTWSNINSMGRARSSHLSTLLPDGRVFVFGGASTVGGALITQGEIWNPSTGLWSDTAASSTGRVRHTVTTLSDGRVLVAGGEGWSGGMYITRDGTVYNPSNNTWTPVANNMSAYRDCARAVLLPDGKVLIAGGVNGSTGQASCDLYDPATNQFSATGALPGGRYSFGMVVLQDGRVLLAGGRITGDTIQSSALIYANGTWSSAGNMSQPRSGKAANYDHSLMPTLLLESGEVIVPANPCSNSNPQLACHKYNVSTGWSQPGNCNFNRQYACGPGASVARY